MGKLLCQAAASAIGSFVAITLFAFLLSKDAFFSVEMGAYHPAKNSADLLSPPPDPIEGDSLPEIPGKILASRQATSESFRSPSGLLTARSEIGRRSDVLYSGSQSSPVPNVPTTSGRLPDFKVSADPEMYTNTLPIRDAIESQNTGGFAQDASEYYTASK